MRLVGELEGVRQHDQIGAILGERQPMRIGEHLRGFLQIDRQPRRDARAAQKRAFRQSDLQRVEAEDIGERAVEVRLLASQQILAERGCEPFRQRAG